jgi:acyl-CoA synthetase (AMP-forming)/AMP-acid ligase II
VTSAPVPVTAGLTVPALLARRAAAAPDAPCVSDAAAAGACGLNHRELDEQSTALAHELIRRGTARRGEPVAWALDNVDGLLAAVLYHAVLKAGAFNVPLNTRLTPPEVEALLTHCGADSLLLRETAQELLTAALLADAPVAALPTTDSDDLASVLYTSGTTGLPKGVEHTHASSVAAGAAWSDAFTLVDTDVLQSPFPVTSGAGLHFNHLSCLWAGAHYVVDQNDLDLAFATIAQRRATVYVAVPAIYQFWLDHPGLEHHDLASLRVLDYGGAAMAPEVIRRLRTALPGIELMQTYGFTEGGPCGTYLAPAYTDHRPGSIGNRAAGQHTEFVVLGADGTPVSPGEAGELFLRGPAGMRGYHRDPAATAGVKSADGWIASGDIVRADNEGFLYFVDRRRELIVRGGYNIAPVEIEAKLLEHPAVREAAAFGTPHPKLGEVPCAAVVLSTPGVTADALREHLTLRLADFKIPRHIHLVASLPTNAAGKVVKQRLRDEFSSPR